MRRTVAVFICVLVTSTPFGVHAELTAPEPELPPSTFTSFTLNGAENNVVIASSTPSVAIAVQAPEEAYFTRLYICQSAVEPCDGSSYTKRFDINATTTAFTREWDGATSSGDIATSSEYQIVARFYRYDIQPDAFEETAPYSITISDTESVENPLPDSDSDQATSTVPSILFTLNDVVDSAIISSTSPSVAITASSSVEVYFSSLSVCLESSVGCTNENAIQRFDVNATTTAFSQVWDGTASSSEPVGADVYRLVARFYTYDVSSEVVEVTASSTITVLRDAPLENENGDTEEIPPPQPPPPSFTRITEASYLESIKNNTASTVWRKAESPYVIEENIYLRFGVLTIEPGVVVKFASSTTLTIHADVTLSIEGTATDPVYFTSLKDDTVGGDTNNDDSATLPAPGDWGYVSFGGGSWNNKMDVQYIKVRYGGGVSVDAFNDHNVYPELYVLYPWFNGSPGFSYTLEHVEATYSAGVGLYIFVGKNNSLTVSDSSFYDNGEYGARKIALTSSRNIDFTGALSFSDNWWGSETGPYHETLNPTGTGDAIVGTKISLNSWRTEDPFILESVRYECCSSVAFLPGFEGSELKVGSNTLWPPTFRDVKNDLKKLEFEDDGTPVTDNVVVGSILNTFDVSVVSVPLYQGFSSFMDTLTVINSGSGTSTIKEWQALPYDWRYSPDDIIKNKVQTANGVVDIVGQIEALAANSYTGKVALVAHSYGGLVGKALIKELENQGKSDLVESFVMVGTPQLGTPQAVAGLLHGDGSDIRVNTKLPIVFLSKKQAQTLGEKLPGAYTLLPSPKYFNEVNDKVLDFGVGGIKSREWRSVYGTEGVTTYNDLVSFLSADLVPRTGGINGLPAVLNSGLIGGAENVHNKYDTFTFPASMRVAQIAGWGLSTIKGITYGGGILKTTYNLQFTTEGDGIVVYPSALGSSNIESHYFNLESYNSDPLLFDVEHKDIVSALPTQRIIGSIIRKIPVISSTFITTEKPKVEETGEKLIVSAHSPVTLGVTDQFGNYTGITPGQDPDADVLLITTDIPGSSYFTVGDAKYLVLPDDGQYTFVMAGTGEGEVTVIVETLSGNNQATTATYTDFLVATSTHASFSVEGGIPSGIIIDKDGDGVVESTVFSDEVLVAQQASARQSENSGAGDTQNTPDPAPVSSGGGGGPLRVTPPVPIVVVEVPAKIISPPPVTQTTVVVSEEEVKPTLKTDRAPIEALPPPEVVVVPPSPVSTTSSQQASAIQSGWYDTFVDLIKRLSGTVISFINSLF